MSVSEAQRFEMHTALRKVMGDEVADTMMEYMPPFGWSDVARKSDIDRLDLRLDQIDKRLDQIDKRFGQVDKRFTGIVGGLWALGTLSATGFIGLFTLIVTKL